MDWVTIALIFFFFVLPIIQEVLAKSRKPPVGHPDEPSPLPDQEELDVILNQRSPARKQPESVPSGGWADDWGSWPSSTPDTGPVEAPAGYRPLQTSPPPLETTAPDPTRVRLEELATRLNRMAEVEAPMPTIAKRSKVYGSPSRPRVQPGRQTRLPLHTRSDLRQAIILSEVLGPPLSMRDSGDRR